jgi:hypothetical protein
MVPVFDTSAEQNTQATLVSLIAAVLRAGADTTLTADPNAGTITVATTLSTDASTMAARAETAAATAEAIAAEYSFPVVATSGGTGQISYTIGDLLYASSSTVLSKLSDVATGNALISGGVGVAPSYGKIGLSTHVSGILPVANGGTGASSISSMLDTAIGSTQGTMAYRSSTGWVGVTLGANGYTWQSNGTDAVWASASPGTGAVRYDLAQTITAAQQAQAQANLNVSNGNKFRNGTMDVNQRGITSGSPLTVTTSGAYPRRCSRIE